MERTGWGIFRVGSGLQDKTIEKASESLMWTQFVRVMLSMGKDLGFFGIVWGILIIAFRQRPPDESHWKTS